jgi:uncharacterized protein (UPF0276 family)
VAAAAAEVAVAVAADRFGLGWRAELAAGILSNLGELDVLEVMADDFFSAGRRELRAMQTLAAQAPVVLHGVSLGLSSSAPVDSARLEKFARVVNAIQPDFWSEHLAFVRSDGLEIGHLAAPPRTDETIEGSCRNLERAARVIGTRPLVENIATLIDPPGSKLDEAGWVSGILQSGNCELLLDLNNLYANAVNFGWSPVEFLGRIPFERVTAVHLAGGKWIAASTGEERLLDDHLHDVPEEVYGLLTEVGARARRPLTVILERDGAFPPFEQLLRQLDRARDALAAGRLRAVAQQMSASPTVAVGSPYRAPLFESSRPSPAPDGARKGESSRPSPAPDGARKGESSRPSPAPDGARKGESYLARLYVDKEARERFLADPQAEAARAGFQPNEREAWTRLDRVGLELASQSFARKRKRAAL